MYGIFFKYKDGDKKYLIERFRTKVEAIQAKRKYVIPPGDLVRVEKLHTKGERS